MGNLKRLAVCSVSIGPHFFASELSDNHFIQNKLFHYHRRRKKRFLAEQIDHSGPPTRRASTHFLRVATGTTRMESDGAQFTIALDGTVDGLCLGKERAQSVVVTCPHSGVKIFEVRPSSTIRGEGRKI